jgi:hypothetical protein
VKFNAYGIRVLVEMLEKAYFFQITLLREHEFPYFQPIKNKYVYLAQNSSNIFKKIPGIIWGTEL